MSPLGRFALGICFGIFDDTVADLSGSVAVRTADVLWRFAGKDVFGPFSRSVTVVALLLGDSRSWAGLARRGQFLVD